MSLVIGAHLPAVVAELLAPVDTHVPAGLFDVEDETYQGIDQEMVKLGGLHQGSIDWPYIEEASRHYLTTQCKQFRIVGHLLTVWLREPRWPQWSNAVSVLAGMVELYWETSHPKPGPTGYLAKRKQVTLLLERLSEAMSIVEPTPFSSEHHAIAVAAVARLKRCAARTQLDQAALVELERVLTRSAERAGAPRERQAQAAPVASSRSLAQSLGVVPKVGALGGERETRRALLSMAELVNQQDLYDPTGYLLRRFALWAHLQAAPAIKRDRCTELPAVPKEVAEGYQEALGGSSIEPALLLRIEKSVVASPFWLRGSYLAATVATRLAMESVAEAIRQSAVRFVQRVPALTALCFSDGSAFVDDQTRAWLSTSLCGGSSNAPAAEFADLREELVTQMHSDGVEVTLLRLQALQSEYGAPRQRCHASVIAADLLSAKGLSWLAEDLYASAARLMAATPAHIWEPDLYQRIAKHGGGLNLADQGMKG
ncbi:type VI secretion system protein TssA [Pseudomonas sp. MAFF212428]|uniref:Type VI secretion system protein TssA n=1 Tax=Pseudomonas brassicae TaxID=2708063 RepID=A0A6B3NU06_9PSED|nr:type VI secretion system protein TssA [Pseudomonas brassicae]NER60159.1 type VI secretion system protein TssA [Pseudomonas brassicae]NER63878.1 type VI secretion system protein TssA [Pseudomonas brassicae]